MSPTRERGLSPSSSAASLSNKTAHLSFSLSLSRKNTLYSQAPSLPLECACVMMENGGVAAERAASAGERRE